MEGHLNKQQAIECARMLIEFIESYGDSSPHNKKGYVFERRFSSACVARGISCVRNGHGRFDFTCNGLRVECKSVSADASGRVSIGPALAGSYSEGDFYVLAVEIGALICIVPSEDIPRAKRGGILSNSIHQDFLRKYHDAWWVIEKQSAPEGFETQCRFSFVSMMSTEATDGR
jgi:hypothetical protein